MYIKREEFEKDFKELATLADAFTKKYLNPHQTIIITQSGIEILSGDKAKSFELPD